MLLTSIQNLLKALDDHHITYCHWKSNEHLKEALDGNTDLDMLFDPVHRTEIERVLDECGLKRFRATPLMQYNGFIPLIPGFRRGRFAPKEKYSGSMAERREG